MDLAYLLETLQASIGRLGVGSHNGRLLNEDQLQRVDVSGSHHEPEREK